MTQCRDIVDNACIMWFASNETVKKKLPMKTMVKMVMVNIKLFISKSGKANKKIFKNESQCCGNSNWRL